MKTRISLKRISIGTLVGVLLLSVAALPSLVAAQPGSSPPSGVVDAKFNSLLIGGQLGVLSTGDIFDNGGMVTFADNDGVISNVTDNDAVYRYALYGNATGTGTSTGAGVGGISVAGYGVYGSSQTGYGIRAVSTSGYGIYASSGSGRGAYIEANGANQIAVQAQAGGAASTGVSAQGVAYGVAANSSAGTGVSGTSTSSNGVRGVSSTGYGVLAQSNSSTGLNANSVSGYGAYVSSTTGSALYADGATDVTLGGPTNAVDAVGPIKNAGLTIAANGDLLNTDAGVAINDEDLYTACGALNKSAYFTGGVGVNCKNPVKISGRGLAVDGAIVNSNPNLGAIVLSSENGIMLSTQNDGMFWIEPDGATGETVLHNENGDIVRFGGADSVVVGNNTSSYGTKISSTGISQTYSAATTQATCDAAGGYYTVGTCYYPVNFTSGVNFQGVSGLYNTYSNYGVLISDPDGLDVRSKIGNYTSGIVPLKLADNDGVQFTDFSGTVVGLQVASNGDISDPGGTVTITDSANVTGNLTVNGISYSTGSTYGYQGAGSTMGGYFYDSNSTGWAYLGYGDRGIWARGSFTGATFDNSNTGIWVDLARSDGYGVYTANNIGAGGKITGTCYDYTIANYGYGAGSDIRCNDFAEVYPASEKTESGDIVMVDPEKTGSLKKARGNSDRSKVLGVVSTSAGVILGVDGKAQIGGNTADYISNDSTVLALAGKVPVKVTTENGKINPGDFIALSSTDGVGMKANDGDATVGVALESYDGSEVGQILILVVRSPSVRGLFESLQHQYNDLESKYAQLEARLEALEKSR